jgi:hypothetical protein
LSKNIPAAALADLEEIVFIDIYQQIKTNILNRWRRHRANK